MFERERLRSTELRGGGWRLGISGARTRTYSVEASFGALTRPFTPCAVTLGGRKLARRAWGWRPRTRVFRARFAARAGSLRVRPCR